MGLSKEERLEVLEMLENLQNNEGSVTKGTASIKVEIGGRTDDGQVRRDVVTIKSAPSKVVRRVTKKFLGEQTEEGLMIFMKRGEE